MAIFLEDGYGKRYRSNTIVFSGMPIEETEDGLPMVNVLSGPLGSAPTTTLVPFYAGAMGDQATVTFDGEEIDLGVRVWFDFSGWEYIRLQSSVLSVSGGTGTLVAQYWVEGNTWSDLCELEVSDVGDLKAESVLLPAAVTLNPERLLRLVARS